MPVLDSDSLSNFITPGRNYPQLKKRITEADPAFLFITIVTVEENLRGLLGRIHADRDKPKASERFQDLQDYLDRIRRLPILPFDAAARAVFDGMPAKVKRQGSNDCRIAAIAISRGETVITSNLGDYKNIPGVVCEDWTRNRQWMKCCKPAFLPNIDLSQARPEPAGFSTRNLCNSQPWTKLVCACFFGAKCVQ